jgi:hypothetical protein
LEVNICFFVRHIVIILKIVTFQSAQGIMVFVRTKRRLDLKGYLSIPELALESNESQSVWRKRLFLRQIAYVKLGRNVRVHRRALENFFKQRIVPAYPARGRPRRGRRG